VGVTVTTEAVRQTAAAADYMTTAATELGAGVAAADQIAKLRSGGALAGIDRETHGIMTEPAPTGVGAYYRLAYWCAIGGRLALAGGAQAQAESLGAQAQQAYEQATALAARGWQPAALLGVGGGLYGAGWATTRATWSLTGSAAPAGDALRRANQNAVNTFLVRTGVGVAVTGVALVGGGVLVARRGQRGVPRRNGQRKLTKKQRNRRYKGIALMALGAAALSPLDEGIVSALTLGAGVPLIPVQGPATALGGVALLGIGGYLAATPKQAE
jgi:hypothetical protein